MARPSASRVRPSDGGPPPRSASDESSTRRVFVVERGQDAAPSGEKCPLEQVRKRLRQLRALLSVL